MVVMRRGVEWWHQWFLGLAQYVSTASKDPSTQVGAVIVDADRRIVSMGFNGLPRGIRDDDRLEQRELKLQMIVHAEANALMYMERGRGLVLYTWPMAPCSRCAALVIQAGIRMVVAPPPSPELAERWGDDIQCAAQMYREANITALEVE